MSSPDTAVEDLRTAAPRVLEAAERALAGGTVGEVPDEAVQQLLLAAVRLFSAKRDLGGKMPALPQNSVTATDVAVTAVALAEVVNIELFELALWRGWSNI
jgi:hypothetical protein